MSKKVLISSLYLYPSIIGGPAKTIFDIATSLSENGYVVTCITTNGGTEQKSKEWEVQTSNLRRIYINGGGKLNLSFINRAFKLISTVDVVYLNSIFFLPNIFIALASIYKNKKVIWAPRGETLAKTSSILKKLWFKFLKCLFENKVIFHATTDEEAISICDKLGKNSKVVIIPNLLKLPKLIDAKPLSNFLLYVGRIAPIKGLDRLIDGLAKSELFKYSNLKLIIVGPVEDKYRSYFNKISIQITNLNLKERVEFVGMIEDPDKKAKLYHDAKVLILPSLSENFGNVVIESLSQGTPVIASQGTPWRKLLDYECGLWIKSDPNEIAEAIDFILSNEKSYLLMRNNSLRLAEIFNYNRTISYWEEII